MDTDPNPFRNSPDQERASSSTEAEASTEDSMEDTEPTGGSNESSSWQNRSPYPTDEEVEPDGSPREGVDDFAQPGDTPQPA